MSNPTPLASMRILHIIASVDPRFGGPIEGVLRQEEVTGGIGGFATREIVTIDPPDAPFLAGFPLKVHALGGKVTGGSARQFLMHLHKSRAVVPWIRTNACRFDFAFVHGLWNYSVFAASRALPGSSLPYFVFTHGMMDPWFRRRYPIKHFFKQLSWLGSEGRLLAAARAVLFTCEEERVQARGEFYGYHYREMVVDYGTVAPPASSLDAELELRQLMPFTGSLPFLLFLGRIHEKKGCDLLIAAFSQVASKRPDLQLVIAGPGSPDLCNALKKQVLALGIADRVHFPGPVFGGAKWALLDAAEAFILPSHQENFGIAVAEALACGTPVLISDKVNIWREIAKAGAGLVAPDTLSGVIYLLEPCLTITDTERNALGINGTELFFERFNVAKTGPELLRAIFQEAVSTEY